VCERERGGGATEGGREGEERNREKERERARESARVREQEVMTMLTSRHVGIAQV
jgi:hypothetical protein